MKYLTTLLFLLLTIPLSAISPREERVPSEVVKPASDEDKKALPWHYMSAGSGVLGLILAFIPYVSPLGILLGGAAMVFGILALRKKQKKRWAWLGIITGGLAVLAFGGVVGLIAFF